MKPMVIVIIVLVVLALLFFAGVGVGLGGRGTADPENSSFEGLADVFGARRALRPDEIDSGAARPDASGVFRVGEPITFTFRTSRTPMRLAALVVESGAVRVAFTPAKEDKNSIPFKNRAVPRDGKARLDLNVPKQGGTLVVARDGTQPAAIRIVPDEPK